jgi:hypothetical protein
VLITTPTKTSICPQQSFYSLNQVEVSRCCFARTPRPVVENPAVGVEKLEDSPRSVINGFHRRQKRLPPNKHLQLRVILLITRALRQRKTFLDVCFVQDYTQEFYLTSKDTLVNRFPPKWDFADQESFYSQDWSIISLLWKGAIILSVSERRSTLLIILCLKDALSPAPCIMLDRSGSMQPSMISSHKICLPTVDE